MDLKQTVSNILNRKVTKKEAKTFALEQFGLLVCYLEEWHKENSKPIYIALGSSHLINNIAEENYKYTKYLIKNNDGDIISWNPRTDNIEELFQHLRGNEDFVAISAKTLKKINKNIAN